MMLNDMLDDDGKLTINTDDLTLAEVDRISKITDDGRAGRTTAIVFVWLKREHPGVDLSDVLGLKMRDVNLVDDDDLASELAAGESESDPTGAH